MALCVGVGAACRNKHEQTEDQGGKETHISSCGAEMAMVVVCGSRNMMMDGGCSLFVVIGWLVAKGLTR